MTFDRETDDDGTDYGRPVPAPEPWMLAWVRYVQVACSGIAPGAAHSHRELAQSLWDLGAAVNKPDPLLGLREYLQHRIDKARAAGKPIPQLRWLVQDAPSWLEMRSRAVPASKPRPPVRPVEEPGSGYTPSPTELREMLAKIGRKLP